MNLDLCVINHFLIKIMVNAMKDYSDWEPSLDYENDSEWVSGDRLWLKHRPPEEGKTLQFDPIPVHELIDFLIMCVYIINNQIRSTPIGNLDIMQIGLQMLCMN